MSKSSFAQRTIERALSDMASREQVVPLLVARTAKKRGLSLSELEVDLLSNAILTASGDSLSIDLDTPCGFGETDAEALAELQAFVPDLVASIGEYGSELAEAVSDAVPEMIKALAEAVGQHLSEHSLEHAAELKRAYVERAETVQRLWGETIKELDFLRSLVVEWGYTASEQRQGAYARPTTAFALNRLFSRAFEIVGEILVLIRSGYADGALARWRSLHEICVIAMFLGKLSDKCAEMYLAHHCIEEFRLLQVDKSSGTAKSSSKHSDRYLRDLKARRDALVAKYGASYANDNGWAAVELGRARVTFKDLETHVGLDILRRGYQRANSTVHGGALATLTRVSLNTAPIDDTHIPPAHGCQTAAAYAASSLSMLVAELCIDTQSPDLVAMSMVIVNRASMVRGEIKDAEAEITGDTPRARMLARRAAQRKPRGKPYVRLRR